MLQLCNFLEENKNKPKLQIYEEEFTFFSNLQTYDAQIAQVFSTYLYRNQNSIQRIFCTFLEKVIYISIKIHKIR